jgi:Uma2 family endonuclease
MTIATQNTAQKRMSLEEYLTYDDGTDVRYELVDGMLVEMGTESTINTLIAMYLAFAIADLGIPRRRFGIKQKIQVNSPYASARDPDLIVHTEQSLLVIEGRQESILRLNEPNPLVIIEIASPGPESSQNYQRDYIQKPAEYSERGIPEYWIIDPDRAIVKIGTLINGTYQFADFTGAALIVSPTFPTLNLTAAQVLNAGE